jgi:hypothetical protein
MMPFLSDKNKISEFAGGMLLINNGGRAKRK